MGSGGVEPGRRTMLGSLRRSGVNSIVGGADATLALRCCVLSGNYEDFWAEQSETGGRQR